MCLTQCCQVFFILKASIELQYMLRTIKACYMLFDHGDTVLPRHPKILSMGSLPSFFFFLKPASTFNPLNCMEWKQSPPKKNKRTSICISSTIMFNGFFDSFLANFPPCTPSNFPQLHLGPQRLLLHLLRVFASVETRCEFIKMWDTRHGSHTYPYTIHVTGISTYIYRKKRCQNVGKYTSPMDGIWASTKNIDFCRHVKSENTQGQCFFNLETVFQRTKWETHRKTFTLVNLTQEETDTRCVTCEGRCSSLAQEFDFQMILWWKKFCTS